MSMHFSAAMGSAQAERVATMLKAVSDLLPQQMNNWKTHFPPIPNPSNMPKNRKKVILSGCTGFLGRNIMGQLIRRKDVSEIYLLVHEKSESDADAIMRAEQRVQDLIGEIDAPSSISAVIKVLAISTTERWNLNAYRELANGLTDIIHAAWPTNPFEHPNALLSHLRGLLEIYNIAALAKQHNPSARFTFLSSTDAVACSTQSPIPKAVSHNPADAALTHYAQSKWMAEQLLYRLSSGSRPHPQPEVRIVRIGQLTGAKSPAQDAAWRLYEKWPLVFEMGLSKLKGKWPDLNSLGFGRLDWLPVNFAARAVLDIAFAEDSGQGVVEGRGLSVAHVVNCWRGGKTWKDIQGWLARPGFVDTPGGKGVKIIPGQQWVEEFKAKGAEHGKVVQDSDRDYPPPNFFEVINRELNPSGGPEALRKDLTFETRRTKSLSFVMKNAEHRADMTEEQLQKTLKWILNEARRFESSSHEPGEDLVGESRVLEFLVLE